MNSIATEPLDLSSELADLVGFMSDVAIAIRMNTPYNGEFDLRNPTHAEDNLWLADCLHNFGGLAWALKKGDAAKLIDACSSVRRSLERYLEDLEPGCRRGAKEAFARNERRFSLATGITILDSIRMKAQRLLDDGARIG